MQWCHGSPGIVASLSGFGRDDLYERTGDERWLERARRFAMHAIEQVEHARETYGRGRYTLWGGDVALYLRGCLEVDAAVPTIDVF